MPTPGSAYLVIGGVSLTLDDLPQTLDFDGEQLVAVRQYPGGGFNAQQLGAYDRPISLKSSLRYGAALSRALALDRLRVTGAPVTMLAPGGIQRSVLITSLKLSVHSPHLVDYDLTLQPMDPPGSMLGSITGGSSASPTSSSSASSAGSSQKGKNYRVKPGDSLWKIAVAYYGSGSKWTTVYNANHLKSKTLTPGQVLFIPLTS